MLGSKPCIVLEGTAFETDPTMKRVGSMFVDWFQGPKLDQVGATVINIQEKENKKETILF